MDVAADILDLPAASLPRNIRSEMSLVIRYGGMGVGDLVALADAAHVGAEDLAVSNAIRFLTTQDARVRGNFHDGSSNGADHVWTVSDYSNHNGVLQAWYTRWRRQRQRTHVVGRTRFVVGALTCRVRLSRSRRVRTPDNHNLSDASSATSNVGSRRPKHDQTTGGLLSHGWLVLARTPSCVCH
jgi:hypothetical protein